MCPCSGALRALTMDTRTDISKCGSDINLEALKLNDGYLEFTQTGMYQTLEIRSQDMHPQALRHLDAYHYILQYILRSQDILQRQMNMKVFLMLKRIRSTLEGRCGSRKKT